MRGVLVKVCGFVMLSSGKAGASEGQNFVLASSSKLDVVNM